MVQAHRIGLQDITDFSRYLHKTLGARTLQSWSPYLQNGPILLYELGLYFIGSIFCTKSAQCLCNRALSQSCISIFLLIIFKIPGFKKLLGSVIT